MNPAANEEEEATIYSLISDLCARFRALDDAKVAHKVLEEIVADLQMPKPNTKRFYDWLMPVTTHLVASERRRSTRSNEGTAFAGFFEEGPRAARGKRVNVTGGAYQPDVTQLRSILNEKFVLGRGGPEVTWGRATVAEHQLRIDSLVTLRNGVESAITRHRIAIEVIGKTGKSCLEEALGAAA